MPTPIFIFGSLALTALLIHRLILVPLFLSPLAAIPAAHWSAPLSRAWILLIRHRRVENATVLSAHARLGQVVRLGPNEVSVHGVEGGIRTVYGGGWEKHDWYSVFSCYGGVRNMFSTLNHAGHARVKRWSSGVYAKSTLLASKAVAAVAVEDVGRRLVGRLAEAAARGEDGGTMEVYHLFSGAAMDFASGYVFGVDRGSRFLLDPEHCRNWVNEAKARQKYLFWSHELPSLTAWLKSFGIRVVPAWVGDATKTLDSWIWSICESCDAAYAGRADEPEASQAVVYNHMRASMKKSQGQGPDAALSRDEHLLIASEIVDHVTAAFDTTGITLTYLAWELSKASNRGLRAALREEVQAWGAQLRALGQKTAGEAGPGPDFRALDAFPLLHGVVMETLRLHAAIPGGQPRISPAEAELGIDGARVAGLPAGVRVNSYAHTLHLEERVYPQADKWMPERWLKVQADRTEIDASGDKSRWFWAFGSGGRMCVGSNLALLEMKAIVATIWGLFETEIADDEGMIKADGYTCEPVGTKDGRFLRLRVRAVA